MHLRGTLTYLRPFTTADLQLWLTWLRDKTRRRHLPYERAPARRVEARRLREYQRHGDRRFLILEQAGMTPVGVIALSPIDKANKSAELFIMLGRPAFEGRGLAVDALRVLLRYAFVELRLNRVELAVWAENRRALRLYTRAGFRLEGRRNQAIRHDGRFHDLVLMGLLRRDYLRHSVRTLRAA